MQPGTPEESGDLSDNSESPVKRKAVRKTRHPSRKSETQESEEGESIIDSEGKHGAQILTLSSHTIRLPMYKCWQDE